MKRKLCLVLAVCLAAAAVGVPAAGLADPVIPETWDEVGDIYGGPDVVQLDFPVYLSQNVNWLEVLDLEQLADYGSLIVAPYSADGALIPEDTWAEAVPATGQHVLGISLEQSSYVLIELVIRGDVLGTGRLNIAQLTRLAQDLNGTNPLEGPYAEAADLNGDGEISIADLPLLARWLTGRLPKDSGNMTGALLQLFGA